MIAYGRPIKILERHVSELDNLGITHELKAACFIFVKRTKSSSEVFEFSPKKKILTATMWTTQV